MIEIGTLATVITYLESDVKKSKREQVTVTKITKRSVTVDFNDGTARLMTFFKSKLGYLREIKVKRNSFIIPTKDKMKQILVFP